MYLPDKMPADLRRAHDALDETVDGLYGLVRPTDTERLEILFDRYEHMAADRDGAQPSNAQSRQR